LKENLKLNPTHKDQLQLILDTFAVHKNNYLRRHRDLKIGNYGALLFGALLLFMFIDQKSFQETFGTFGHLVVSCLMIFCLPFSSLFNWPKKWDCSKEMDRLRSELKGLGYDGIIMNDKIFYEGADTGLNVFKPESYYDKRKKISYVVKKITMYGTNLIGEYDSFKKAQEVAKEIEEANLDSFNEDFIEIEHIERPED